MTLMTQDLADLASADDRFAVYRRLRDVDPVARVKVNGEEAYLLTRYADVNRLLKNPASRVQPQGDGFPDHIGTGPASVFYRYSLPSMDAPTHSRLRKLASAAFSHRAVAAMQSWVEDIIGAGIDRLKEFDGEFDFVAEFASRVPAEIACRLLHAPMSDARSVLEQMPDIAPILSQSDLTPEKLAAADAAAQFYIDYIGDLVDTLRGELDSDDAVGALMEVEEEGSRMSRTELIITLVGFFVASYHTTMVALTNAVCALSTHPHQMRMLADDPDLAPKAWEEVLRYMSPVHVVHRYAGKDIEIDDQLIPQGSQFLLAVAAANRDERFFDHPDTFDIERESIRHLAFSGGVHYCLGAALSRLEGTQFLRVLPARLPEIRITTEHFDWGDDITFPFLRSMMVTAAR